MVGYASCHGKVISNFFCMELVTSKFASSKKKVQFPFPIVNVIKKASLEIRYQGSTQGREVPECKMRRLH